MSELISLCEFQHLCAKEVEGTRYVPPSVFDSLELFLAGLADNTQGDAEEYKDVFQISNRNGYKTLAVQNYVGVITCGDTTIEILPKIAKGHLKHGDVEKYRATLLHMLTYLNDLPLKQLSAASIGSKKNLPIFEFFISAFLDEVDAVIKQGVRSDYVEVEGNERFLKGKIDFVEQIRQNHSDASRFAQRYSIYHVNRPENRLIKSAIELVKRASRDIENRRRLRIVSEHFDEVEPSVNIKSDLLSCGSDRNTAHYGTVLRWAKIFLSSFSPAPIPGMLETKAFLFPMETVFESYVASSLAKACRDSGITIETQVSERSLVTDEYGAGKYQLVPDMVATRNADGKRIILDTKWKVTDEPSQADMYQMFAYAARYEVDDVILVYPHTDQRDPGFRRNYFSKIDSCPIRIQTYYYDLPVDRTVGEESAENLAEDILRLLVKRG